MTIGKLAYSTALPSSPPLSGFDPFFFPICPTRIVLQRVLGEVTVGAAFGHIYPSFEDLNLKIAPITRLALAQP